MDEIDIAVTCVPLKAEDVSGTVRQISPFASAIHIDIDDGVFAPLVSWPYDKTGTFGPFELNTEPLRADVHLMVREPLAIGAAFAEAGATLIMGHIEAFASVDEARRAFGEWRKSGASQVGLGALFQTPLESLAPLVAECDVVHLMSIASIGTQGIPYQKSAPQRIAQFHEMYPDALISVDGGVSHKNITDLVRAGARRFGVGSAIVKAADPAAAYRELKALAESALQ